MSQSPASLASHFKHGFGDWECFLKTHWCIPIGSLKLIFLHPFFFPLMLFWKEVALRMEMKLKAKYFCDWHTLHHSCHFLKVHPKAHPPNTHDLPHCPHPPCFICATCVLHSDTYWTLLCAHCLGLTARSDASLAYLPAAHVLVLVDPRCFSTCPPSWSEL